MSMNNMKRKVAVWLTALAATSAIALTAQGQTPQNQEQQTTLRVDVTVERQEIVAGPYARYSQKFLGVTAPLADKVLHKVTDVKLLEVSANAVPQNDSTQPGDSAPFTHMKPAKGFPRLTVDRLSATTVSLEESARRAADKIFELRRSRLDLITGNVGENVFGGGLGAALNEISNLEEEYLSLFLGRETIALEQKHYQVTPTRGHLTYTVCRFSEEEGLVPQDEMSGAPIVLELKPVADPAAQTAVAQQKPNSRAVPKIIPAEMTGRVIYEGSELASERFSIRQLGETIWVNP
jgi:hypothetical protein